MSKYVKSKAAALAAFCCFILFVLGNSSARVVSAYDEYELSVFSSASGLISDSSSSGGYVCAFSGKTVYSARLVPDFSFYSFKVDGAIRSVSQSGRFSCALSCDNLSKNRYTVSISDTNTKAVKSFVFYEESFDASCFSVTGGCVYLIKTDAVYTYVKRINLTSGKSKDFKFSSQNVSQIFNNNSNTYAKLYDGSIYKLSSDKSEYILSTEEHDDVSNAGVNRIFTNGGRLVSLADGSSRYVSHAKKDKICATNFGIVYSDGTKLIRAKSDKTTSVKMKDYALAVVADDDRCGVLLENGTALALSSNDFASSSSGLSSSSRSSANTDKNHSSGGYTYSDGIVGGIESGVTVTQFKKQTSAADVFGSSGEEVKSGKLKTGYSAKIGSVSWEISVRGDVTGEGNVNSRDTSLLIKYLCGKEQLSGAYKFSADFNLDASVNNRDLVLISRQN